VIVGARTAGGTGATSLAVNLAWELRPSDKKNPPKVCLLDFDLQFGAVANLYGLLASAEVVL